jgi:hypothetical protein
MEEQNNLIKKIELYSFLQILLDLYESGVDFIDLWREKGVDENQSIINIGFSKEYTVFKDDEVEEDDDKNVSQETFPPSTTKINILSDDDLNQLI